MHDTEPKDLPSGRTRRDRRSVALAALLWVVFVYQLAVYFVNRDFSLSLLAHSFAPDAGLRESLPAPAIEAMELVQRNKIQMFHVDQVLTVDGGLIQRIVEATYPAKLSESAPALIATKGATEGAACRIADESEHLALYDCR